MKIERVRHFVDLGRRLRDLDAEVGAIKAERKQLEGQLIRDFSMEGVDRIAVDGTTVFVRKDVRARLKSEEGETTSDTWHRLVPKLEEGGLGDVIQPYIHPSRLSAIMREFDDDENPTPEPLKEAVEVYEQMSVRTRG